MILIHNQLLYVEEIMKNNIIINKNEKIVVMYEKNSM